jgi:hypothetical protein
MNYAFRYVHKQETGQKTTAIRKNEVKNGQNAKKNFWNKTLIRFSENKAKHQEPAQLFPLFLMLSNFFCVN